MREKIIKYWEEITNEIKEEKKNSEYKMKEWAEVWEHEHKMKTMLEKYTKEDEEFINTFKKFDKEYWSK